MATRGIHKRKPCSEETKRKIGDSQLGNKNHMYGKHCSLETKRKMSLASIGKPKSEQAKINMSKGRTGIIFTKEHKKNIGLGGIGLHAGELSGNWKGGISKIDKLCRRMSEYRQWRSDVFQRDNWTCKTCGLNGCYVTAHHIKSFSKIIKENNIKNILEARECKELWDLDNGITLCEECHKLTDNYKGRANKKIIKK